MRQEKDGQRDPEERGLRDEERNEGRRGERKEKKRAGAWVESKYPEKVGGREKGVEYIRERGRRRGRKVRSWDGRGNALGPLEVWKRMERESERVIERNENRTRIEQKGESEREKGHPLGRVHDRANPLSCSRRP